MKKILISNDDGVLAPGIFAAKEAVKDLGEVIVVAPQENNSGVGRRLSMFKHINLKKYGKISLPTRILIFKSKNPVNF